MNICCSLIKEFWQPVPAYDFKTTSFSDMVFKKTLILLAAPLANFLCPGSQGVIAGIETTLD